MKVKHVILVTALVMMAISIWNTADGQAVWVGEHSPVVAYNPVTHTYLGIHRSYTEQANPWGRFIDRWGSVFAENVFASMGCADNHGKPSIAYNRLNNAFFVTWTGEWPHHDLYASLLDAIPFYANSRFVVSSAPGTQANSIVTPDDMNGRFLVTWTDDRNTDGSAIYGQLVSGEGELYGTELMIQSGFGSGYLGYPEPFYAVAYDNVNQRYLVVWSWEESIADQFIVTISGQFINADGTPLGEKFTIMEERNDYPSSFRPALAYDTINQRYLLVWVSHHDFGLQDLTGHLLNSDGSLHGTPLPMVVSWEANNPSVAYDNINQRFLVAWSSNVISGQFINADGTFQGDKIAISYTGALHWDVRPSIAFNPACGNFLVASVSRTNLNIPGIEAIESDINYTVVGDPCPSATLIVKKKGPRAVRSSVGDNDAYTHVRCTKKTCTSKYLLGSEISLTAYTEDNRTALDSWTGCDSVVDNVCNVTMNMNKKVTAKFVGVPKKSR